jgi:hypothetical protein
MKFGELKSIAHNISASLASGNGLLIGVFDTNIFLEAAHTREGYVDVDFLTGRVSGRATLPLPRWLRLGVQIRGWITGKWPEPDLAEAVELYAKALPVLCAKHGVTREAFRTLSTRYHASSVFEVTIEDQHGRRSVDSYAGRPGARLLRLDALGRIRPVPPVQTRSEK